MSWFGERYTDDPGIDQGSKEDPYLSLTDGKPHIRNFEKERIEEIKKKVNEFSDRRASIQERKRESKRFISDPYHRNLIQVTFKKRRRDTRLLLIILMIISLSVTPIFLLDMSSLAVGLIVYIVINLSVLISLIITYNKMTREHKKEMKRAMEGYEPPPRSWVVIQRRKIEVCFERDTVQIPIHLLDIGSIETNVMNLISDYDVKRVENIILAPDPWKVPGALYPLHTPIENLISIRFTRELELPSFRAPTLMRAEQRSPNMGYRRSVKNILISIRPDERSRFLEAMDQRIKIKDEIEEGGYLDEWE